MLKGWFRGGRPIRGLCKYPRMAAVDAGMLSVTPCRWFVVARSRWMRLIRGSESDAEDDYASCVVLGMGLGVKQLCLAWSLRCCGHLQERLQVA